MLKFLTLFFKQPNFFLSGWTLHAFFYKNNFLRTTDWNLGFLQLFRNFAGFPLLFFLRKFQFPLTFSRRKRSVI